MAGLGARSKPRGECHRFMAEQLPAPPAPPQHPKLSSIPASTFNSLLSLLQIHFGNQLLAIDDISTWIPKRKAAQLSKDLTLTIPQYLDEIVARIQSWLDNLGGSLAGLVFIYLQGVPKKVTFRMLLEPRCTRIFTSSHLPS